MSNSRQSAVTAAAAVAAAVTIDPSPIARSLALRFPPRYRIDDHAHGWAQVVYAARGALSVEIDTKRWIVPPHRSLWVPADTAHSIETIGEVWMRTVYLRPQLAAGIAAGIRVMEVSPLLRELMLETVRLGMLDEGVELHRNLASVLAAKLAEAPELPLNLPLPTDSRARRVADRLRGELEQSATLTALAQDAGASPRTIERLFLLETGLSFGLWRQQARLQHAVCRLAEGADVTSIAAECGYESVSAFVAMFRQSLGTTPGQYMRDEVE